MSSNISINSDDHCNPPLILNSPQSHLSLNLSTNSVFRFILSFKDKLTQFHLSSNFSINSIENSIDLFPDNITQFQLSLNFSINSMDKGKATFPERE